MKFRSAYDSSFRGSDLECKDPSLTQQQFAEEADINVMMAHFGVTGQMPAAVRMPNYGDFSGISDFRSAMAVVTNARDEFMTLPADVRARFGNDPGQLIAFLEDKSNRDEAIKMGLIATPAASGGGDGGKPPMEGSVPS